jgi:hypothetical protein
VSLLATGGFRLACTTVERCSHSDLSSYAGRSVVLRGAANHAARESGARWRG